MAPRHILAARPGAVLLSELWPRDLDYSPTHGRRIGRLCLGTAYSVPAMDDHSVLVDRRALWIVPVYLYYAARAGHPCAPIADRANYRRQLFHSVPTHFHVPASGAGGDRGTFVRGPGAIRQAVQSGPVIAHRVTGYPVGTLRPIYSVLVWSFCACLVRVDWHFRTDNVSTSFPGYPNRRVAGVRLHLALARGHVGSTQPDQHHGQPQTPPPGRLLRGRCRDFGTAGDWVGRHRPVVALARRFVVSRRGQLRDAWPDGVPKNGRWRDEPRGAMVVRAVPRWCVAEFAGLDLFSPKPG